jgi:acyl-CoA thioester hydrolase
MTDDTFLHEVDVTADLIDAFGILYHANFLLLAERAREAALKELGTPVDQLWNQGCGLPVRDLSVQYRKPVFVGSRLAIVTRITAISESRLEVVQQFFLRHDPVACARVRASDRPAAEVRLVVVCMNVLERRIAALPARLLQNIGFGSTPATLKVAS